MCRPTPTPMSVWRPGGGLRVTCSVALPSYSPETGFVIQPGARLGPASPGDPPVLTPTAALGLKACAAASSFSRKCCSVRTLIYPPISPAPSTFFVYLFFLKPSLLSPRLTSNLLRSWGWPGATAFGVLGFQVCVIMPALMGCMPPTELHPQSWKDPI